MRVRKFQALRQNLRGARVVAQRRGLKYFGYLLTGVAWPQALYRFGWGPNASALGRRVFDRAGKWAGEEVAPAAAREAGLLIGLGQVGAKLDCRRRRRRRDGARARGRNRRRAARARSRRAHSWRRRAVCRDARRPSLRDEQRLVPCGARCRSSRVQRTLRTIAADRGGYAAARWVVSRPTSRRATATTRRSILAAG